MLQRNPTIARRITLLVLIMVCSSASIGIAYIYFMERVQQKIIQESRQATLEGYKRTLATSIHSVSAQLGAMLEDVPGDMSPEALRHATEEMRYGEDGYYFIYDMNGINIAHPLHSEFKGISRLHHKDPYGKEYIAELTEKAASGGGFVKYWFAKPGQAYPSQKLVYSERIPGTSYWIATGFYIDSITHEQDELSEKLHSHMYRAIIMVVVGTLAVLAVVIVPVSLHMVGSIIEPWRQMERGLHQAQKMEAIGVFAGGIAHDFNNILGAIISCGELALAETRGDSPLNEDLRRILHAANRGKTIVRRLRAFGAPNKGKKRPVHPGRVLEECLQLLRTFIPPTVTVQVYNRCRSALISADPDQYLQIIMNLCTNAVQAMSGGRGTLRLDLFVRDVGTREAEARGISNRHYVVLEVRDTGHGIAPSALEKIFDPFFTTRKYEGGTGLGLSVVESIVRNSHGDIRVASTVGEGTTFSVLMPYAGNSMEKDVPVRQENVHCEGTERIMLVDDDEDMAYPVQKLFERCGYQVAVFSSGVDALNAFRVKPADYDLLLTDQLMPHMTGTELIRVVKTLRPELPTILYSGFEGEGYSSASDADWKRQGVSRFFRKPFDTYELCKVARELLDENTT